MLINLHLKPINKITIIFFSYIIFYYKIKKNEILLLIL